MSIITREKGITLIALVITILVLLLLAGVAIQTLSGENSLIVNTSKAKFSTEVKEIEEQVRLKQMGKNEGEDFSFGTLYDLIGRNDAYNEILSVEYGKLVYEEDKVTNEQAKWLEELNIYPKTNSIPIYTKEQLEKVGTGEKINIEQVGGREFTFSIDGYYVLQNDIDLQGNEEDKWEGIANFRGIFEGKNYCISGIYGANGLFYSNSGTIQNLKVEGNIDTTINYVGGITNRNLANGKVINCENRIIIKASSNNYVGGIAGINQGEVRNCINNSYLELTASSGGIVGQNAGTVIRCANIHEILLKDFSIGGIVGINSGTVEECYNDGEILAPTTYVRYGKGGIVGRNNGIIRKCYNLKNVVANSNNWNIGGIAGDNQANGEIYFCYNIGEVTGSTRVIGGIVGENIGSITNCYTLNNMEVLGKNSGEMNDCLKLTEQQMKNQEGIQLDDGSTSKLVDLLNKEGVVFVEDTEVINNGYPILNN